MLSKPITTAAVRRRPLVLALAVQLVILAALLLVALDLYAHKRVERLGGVNIWGYRGPVARQRQPNEIRVSIVGGTRAFGFGQPASGTAAIELRRLVMLTTDRPGQVLRPVVVTNLARFGASAETYRATIERYAHLQPDFVCIYDDLGIPPTSAVPRSGVFSWTGYEPALPLVLREKGMLWRYGSVRQGYAPGHGVSTTWPRRMAGFVLQSTGSALAAVDEVLARAGFEERSAGSGTPGPADYVQSIMTAIDAAHQTARGVVLVVSPAETEQQTANLRALEGELPSQLAERSWLRFVDLGGIAELRDPSLRVDGWSYGAAGISMATAAIAPAVLDLIQRP